jgi:hypothetical protein
VRQGSAKECTTSAQRVHNECTTRQKLCRYLRRATLSPTADFPEPMMPMRYRLEPPNRGPRSLAGSIFMPSSSPLIKSGFLKGLSTPWSKASPGSSHSKPLKKSLGSGRHHLVSTVASPTSYMRTHPAETRVVVDLLERTVKAST